MQYSVILVTISKVVPFVPLGAVPRQIDAGVVIDRVDCIECKSLVSSKSVDICSWKDARTGLNLLHETYLQRK